MNLTRNHIKQASNFAVRASASVFNVFTVWVVFRISGDEWSGLLYLQLSSLFIISTLTRLGIDQSMLLSAKRIYIPVPFFISSFLVSVAVYGIADEIKLVPELSLWTTSFLLLLASAIAYAEAVIRTLPESAYSHACVIAVQSLCILCTAPFKWNTSTTLTIALILQLAFYLILIHAKQGTVEASTKGHLEVSVCGLVHGSHGLINQNFLNYFVTRFGFAGDLPYLVTLVRILYLSSWPLSQFTFSGIYEKSRNSKAFRESGLLYGACGLAVFCFFVMLAYSYTAPVEHLLPSGLLLSIGIILFSLCADKMYRPVKDPAYYYIFPFQIFLITSSLAAGHVGVLNNFLIVGIFSFYLTACSLFSRFYP